MSESAVFDISGFADTMKSFDSELIDGNYEDMINDIKEGKFEFDYKKIFSNVGKIFIKELRSNIGLAIEIVLIALILGLLDNLKSSFSSEGVSKLKLERE